MVGRLEQVWIYPVRSLAGTPLTTVEIDPRGPRGDRALSVVAADSGKPVRAKHAPVLATLTPTGDPTADERAIGAALGRPVRLEPASGGSAADVAAVHLVSRQAVDRASAGEVPEGCSADDPRANLLLSLPRTTSGAGWAAGSPSATSSWRSRGRRSTASACTQRCAAAAW